MWFILLFISPSPLLFRGIFRNPPPSFAFVLYVLSYYAGPVLFTARTSLSILLKSDYYDPSCNLHCTHTVWSGGPEGGRLCNERTKERQQQKHVFPRKFAGDKSGCVCVCSMLLCVGLLAMEGFLWEDINIPSSSSLCDDEQD